VFLTDRHAYKLKKPVKFEFLDFSTVARRRRACQDELRLNRRLAPEVYLAVLPVTRDQDGALELAGRGTAVDWVVQMKRLPAEKAVDVILRNQRLEFNDATVIAQHLTRFYTELPPDPLTAGAYRQALARHIRANGNALVDALPEQHVRIQRIQGAQLQYLTVDADLFDRRVEEGRIVDGHGDLRPEHIYLTTPPAIIDCIEFSDELRRVDIADELSFLAMECQRLGDAARRLVLAAYQRVCRTKSRLRYSLFIAATGRRAARLPCQLQKPGQTGAAGRLTRQYLDWADHYAAEFVRPSLLIVGGLMGTGKSSLAAKLAEAFGAKLLSTDHFRRSLLGASRLPAGYAEGNYVPCLRDRIYDEVLHEASDALCKGRSVILDGTFLTHDRRRRAYDLGRRHNVVPLYVMCTCPRQTALARIQQRARREDSESEARTDLYDRQAAEFQAPRADDPAVSVDTTHATSQQLRAVCDRLRSLMCA
jgi:aminoglycoside phosphotransferase family enzyme/predicted kinase